MSARSWMPIALSAAMLATMTAHADISISGSRFIYHYEQKHIDVQLRQVGNAPGIVQTWLEEADSSPDIESLPVSAFDVKPDIMRMSPGAHQIVRIARIQDNLPQDRESLFWLHIMETPPYPEDNAIPGVCSRIKFFYRPPGLPSAPEQAHERLRFALLQTEVDNTLRLQVYNPSPYHITFRKLALHDPTNAQVTVLAELSADASGDRMVAPMGNIVMTLTRKSEISTQMAGATVVFSTINDYGGNTDGQRDLLLTGDAISPLSVAR